VAINSNSYGSVDDVAALVRRYTDAGSFTGETRPAEADVEGFINRTSATLNVLLAEAGFAIPVGQADAKAALDDFVVNQAVQLAHAANGAGPYAPGNEKLRGSPAGIILSEAETFVMRHAAGLEALGATRTYAATYGLQCREEDDGGDEIVPPFQREMIGHEIMDWDT